MSTYTSKLNKGQLNFDDQKIIGALGQSGDEAGNDTIELVPDIDLYNTHQYLVVDPTAPDHIHIRAGGAQDDSDATLILGGELSNITIDDQADAHVSILSRDQTNIASHLWQFNNDGSTRFPAVTVNLKTGGATPVEAIKFANNALNSVITGPTPSSGVAASSLIIQGQDHTGAAGGDINIWAGRSNTDGGNIDIEAGTTSNSSTGTPGDVSIKGGGNAGGTGGDVTLTAGTGAASLASLYGKIGIVSGTNTWNFNNNGTTKFPYLDIDLHTGGPTNVEAIKFSNNARNSVITGAAPNTGTAAKPLIIQGHKQTGAAGGDVYLWGGDSNTAGGSIEILAGDNDGPSGTAGIVTIKGGDGATGFAGGNVAITGGTGTVHGEVTIASSSNTWTFNNDGNITVPAAKDILEHNGGSLIEPSGYNSLSSGGNRVKSVNSASAATVSYSTENIILIATNTAGAQPTTVFLPEIKDIPVGYTVTVMDSDGGAAGKNITVKPKAADEIISIGPAASGGIIIDTSYGLVTLKNVIAGWAILYGR